jgi:hypothetical protein
MKTLIIALLSSLIIVSVVTASADTLSNPLEMKQLIYASKIDGKLTFYQSLTYLTDSKYSILSEIGQDADTKVHFIKTHREKLLDDMISSNVSLNKNDMNMFLTRRINKPDSTWQLYSLK